MKKIIVLIFSLLILVGCQNIKTDSQLFKEEYESLNGKTNDNGLEYFNVDIPLENKVVYMKDADDVIYQLTHGTHIIYFGFNTCPWCRQMVPLLLESCDKYVGVKIYYYDFRELRQNFVDQKDETLSNKYKEIMEIIGDYNTYTFDFETNVSRLVAPTVLFVKNSEIIGCHISTVDEHTDGYVLLTKKQKEEIVNIYCGYIDQIIKDNQGCSECK